MKQSLSGLMKYVSLSSYGAPSVFKLGETNIPQIKENQSLVEIISTSINRADTLQRQGKYPAPKGTTEILGLEVAGYELDQEGNRIRRVMSIIPGGGYAQYAAVNKNHLIEIPENISFEIAGGISEVYLTAFLQLRLSQIQKGNSCLIYAAGSGVGQATLQLCNLFGITGIASCSKSKSEIVSKYTDKIVIRDIEQDEQLKQIKQYVPQGVDAVFDCVGPQNAKLTVDSLGLDGKWILYGLISGAYAEKFNFATLLAKRISLISTTLRSRSEEFKSQLIEEFKKTVLPHIANGHIQIPVDEVAKIKWNEDGINQFIRFHEIVEANKNTGKLIIAYDK